LPAFPPPEAMRRLLPPFLPLQQEEPAAFSAYRQFYGTAFAQAKTYSGLLRLLNYELVAQLWQPENPRATLIFLHGYYDHLGLYRHLIAWALAQGFAVLSCDLPGHGLSSGERASIGDFSEYQAVLSALLQQAAALKLPQPWHLLGQSTGGGILLDYLLRGTVRPEVGQVALLAPLIRPRAWLASKLLWRSLNPFAQNVKRRFSDNSGDSAFLAFVRSKDSLQPLRLPLRWVAALVRWIPKIESAAPSARTALLVQGDADMTLDWRHNLKVLEEKLPQTQRLLLPGARHHLVNETEDLRKTYFAFLAERMN